MYIIYFVFGLGNEPKFKIIFREIQYYFRHNTKPKNNIFYTINLIEYFFHYILFLLLFFYNIILEEVKEMIKEMYSSY